MSDKQTIEVYNQNVEKYRALVDKLPNTKTLKSFMSRFKAGATILDFGCGPGRDLITFASLGHRAIGLDGSRAFVEMAQRHSGCEVWQQQFLGLQLGRENSGFTHSVHIPYISHFLHSGLHS